MVLFGGIKDKEFRKREEDDIGERETGARRRRLLVVKDGERMK